MANLSPDERTFFERVSEAVFVNPFSESRRELDRALVGADTADRATIVDRLVDLVGERLRRLEPIRLDDYDEADRERLELSILFHFFHDVSAQLDALIERQDIHGDEPLDVEFADDVLDGLQKRGFSAEEACRYLGMFYQMRRAFTFISTTLVGPSTTMEKLRERLWATIFTADIQLYERYLWDRMEDFSTFLVGETGTGKGTAAAAVGRSGWIPFDRNRGRFQHSFTRSFLPINLSEYPESLIESELFGHKKGAFTGAVEDHQGVFARCLPHGMIFLDEIGEVGTSVQVKLLRVVQERVFTPVGGHGARRFEGRVLAATNQPLSELRAEGRFRDDLYYRLCSDIIEVPPLRHRIAENADELPILVESIAERIVGQHAVELVDLVLHAIERDVGLDYAWPGNVRELEQCVRRVLLTRSYEGDPGHLVAARDPVDQLAHEIDAGDVEARELVSRYCRILYDRFGTYTEVARRTGLDRRTVKSHVD